LWTKLSKEVSVAQYFGLLLDLPPAGVTVVQYRDKSNDTGVLVETARKLHQITQKYNVPLLINDRVDVALAIGAEGVHLGQDDMSQSPKLFFRYIY
jgi:thiamine-phosphate diphosphorylase